MRFTITEEAGLFRVAVTLRPVSAKEMRHGLRDIQTRLPECARVLLEVAEAGHLKASEVGAFLEWACATRAQVAELVLCTHHRGLLALFELVCAHHVVRIFEDAQQATEFLLSRDAERVEDKVDGRVMVAQSA